MASLISILCALVAVGAPVGGAPASDASVATSTAVRPIQVQAAPIEFEDPIAPEPREEVLLGGRPLREEGLDQVLDELPGVQRVALGGLGSFAQVSIRGTELDHTTVLIDDVPVAAPDRGPLDLSLLPLDGFERLELYRGSAPIRYGLGSIGAVLRLVPKTQGQARVRGQAQLGSYGLVGLSAEGEGWQGGLSYTAAASLKAAKNNYPYEDDNGTAYIPEDDQVRRRDNADVVQANAFSQVSYQRGGHRLFGMGMFVQRAQGLPGPAIALAPDARSRKTRLIGAFGYRYRGEATQNPLSGFLSAAISWDRERTRDEYGQIGLGTTDSEDDYLGLETRGGLFVRPLPVVQLGTTLRLRQDSLQPYNRLDLSQTARSTRERVAVAAELLLTAPWAALPASLRASIGREHSWARIRATTWMGPLNDDSRDHQTHTRLEAKVEPLPGLQLHAMFNSGSRPPTMMELFGNGSTVIGKPLLLPERGDSLELGLTLARRLGPLWLSAEAAAYRLWMEDLIMVVRTSQHTITFKNRQQVDTRGLESKLGLRWGDVSLQGALSWMHAEQTYYDFLRELPLRAPLTAFARLRYAPKLSAALRLGGFVELNHRSRVFLDPANIVRLPGSQLIHLGASARLFQKLTVAASARNVFDVRRMDVLSYPRPGRSYEIRLQYQESL